MKNGNNTDKNKFLSRDILLPYTFMFKKLKKITILIPVIVFSNITAAQPQDCITAAARCHQINPLLIKAIIWNESRNHQDAINKNKNNTIDVGVMQINSIHFKELTAMGLSKQDLYENSCANVFAGTWILRQSIQRYGYTWDGVGNYHSSTPLHHDTYIKKIIDTIAYKLPLIKDLKIEEQNNIQEKFNCLSK